MNAYRLDGYKWSIQPNCLTVRATWLVYAMGCVIAVAVLIGQVVVVRSVIANPSIRVGASRHSRGTEVQWAQQTFRQRSEHLACVGFFVVPVALFALVYLVTAYSDRRNPLTFDRSNNLIRKGGKVLATLSAANSVAVVQIRDTRQILPEWQSAPQIFIRFKTEPWSFQIHCYSRTVTSDRVAAILAEFLSVPIVYDPIVVGPPRAAGRGFPVIMKEPRNR